jgi:hypothetical protein
MSESYLSFQTYWPGMMSALWCNSPLANAIVESGTPRLPGMQDRQEPVEEDAVWETSTTADLNDYPTEPEGQM